MCARLSRRPQSQPQPHFGRLFDNQAAKSPLSHWFSKNLAISHLKSKIWRKFPANSMIPLDRGRGYPILTGYCLDGEQPQTLGKQVPQKAKTKKWGTVKGAKGQRQSTIGFTPSC